MVVFLKSTHSSGPVFYQIKKPAYWPDLTYVVELPGTAPGSNWYGRILLTGTPLVRKNATGRVCLARMPREAEEKAAKGCI